MYGTFSPPSSILSEGEDWLSRLHPHGAHLEFWNLGLRVQGRVGEEVGRRLGKMEGGEDQSGLHPVSHLGFSYDLAPARSDFDQLGDDLIKKAKEIKSKVKLFDLDDFDDIEEIEEQTEDLTKAFKKYGETKDKIVDVEKEYLKQIKTH